MITAPYNFVPLNKEIFYPSWSDQVSHDIPFADGESGEITLTITSKSPIFISNHNNDNNKTPKEFCHHINQNGAKEYYIPGSSIKGMLRNVLEIMSFSKIAIDDNILKTNLSVRDMTNQRELVGSANGCGFLIKNDKTFQIKDCGDILTISHTDLENLCPKIKNLESGKAKYEHFGIQKIPYKSFKKMMDVRGKQIPKIMATIDHTSTISGTLVFTGDIRNKKHEFIFRPNGKFFRVDESVYNSFSNVYFKDKSSLDGQFWFDKLQHNSDLEIPVFYKKDKDTNQITAIGLTQLFKLSYQKTLFEAAKQKSDPNKLDLSETIFGNARKNMALKGRVHVSHFKSTIQRFDTDEIKVILGTPKPTYYPNYIKQIGNHGQVTKYKTLMDPDAVIAGWKRYPLHRHAVPSIGGNDKENVKTHFIPLPADTIFEGKIRFHNLKKVEIGALLSAITFHGQNGSHMHNIGMGKPLGYGKINIEINLKSSKYSITEYLNEFEEMMTSAISNWKESLQLKELFAISNVNTLPESQLQYQLLENPNPKYERDKNDFTGAKKLKEYLLPFSSLHQDNNKKTLSTELTPHVNLSAKLQKPSKQSSNNYPKTSEEWKERVYRELENPARSFKGILNDLKMNARCYQGHTKNVAQLLKLELINMNRWPDDTQIDPNHKDYQIICHIKEYLCEK